MSKPVVAYSRGGARETIIDGVTGALFEAQTVADVAAAITACERIETSPEEIAQRLVQLLEDSALRARMGAAGRLAAERKFDLAGNLDTLMRAYGFE